MSLPRDFTTAELERFRATLMESAAPTEYCPACQRPVYVWRDVEGTPVGKCMDCLLDSLPELPHNPDSLMLYDFSHPANPPGCKVDWTGRANWSLDPDPSRRDPCARTPIELSALRSGAAMYRVITDNPNRRFIWDPPRPWWKRWDHDYWQRA